jgi:hypothetical protein
MSVPTDERVPREVKAERARELMSSRVRQKAIQSQALPEADTRLDWPAPVPRAERSGRESALIREGFRPFARATAGFPPASSTSFPLAEALPPPLIILNTHWRWGKAPDGWATPLTGEEV